ncbi:MAG: hypothetical protein H7X99_08720 [Saprospiraceae bacterium]|nr:hypothetical protein [Saprospiraceae bacterium]
MKYSSCCPKCQNTEIAVVAGGGFKGNLYNTITFGFSTVYLTRYVCTVCGFTENYVDDSEDLQKMKDKFCNPGKDSEFV